MIPRLVIVWCGVVVATASYTPAPPGGKPPCARKGATFCEQVETYPSKVIKELLQSKSLSLEDFFTDESEGLDSPPDYILDYPTPEPRRKGRSLLLAGLLQPPCAAQLRSVTPQMAQDAQGRWRVVAQGEGAAKQEVRMQLCDQSDECSRYCLQMYSQVPLVFLDSNGTLAKTDFWMPSSCRCMTEPLNDEENEIKS